MRPLRRLRAKSRSRAENGYFEQHEQFLFGHLAGYIDRPGVFDYYVLVLVWSPTHCILDGHERRDKQYETGHDFVLHGLEGSSSVHYMRGIASKGHRQGWTDIVRLLDEALTRG